MSSRRRSTTKQAWARSRSAASFKDSETLQSEMDQLKKKFAAVRQDNVYMRTTNQRLQTQLRKKDKQMQHILSIKISGLNEKVGDATIQARIKALKDEMMAISRLSNKVRDLENEVAEKDEELKLLKSSMKFTLIKELQIEAQTYFNEARRLKKQLDNGGMGAGYGRNSSRSLMGQSKSRAGGRFIEEGSPGELEALREEVKALRREGVYLRSEREMEDKSYSMLQSLRRKMDSLSGELNDVQSHMRSIDESRGKGELARMIDPDGDDEYDGGRARNKAKARSARNTRSDDDDYSYGRKDRSPKNRSPKNNDFDRPASGRQKSRGYNDPSPRRSPKEEKKRVATVQQDDDDDYGDDDYENEFSKSKKAETPKPKDLKVSSSFGNPSKKKPDTSRSEKGGDFDEDDFLNNFDDDDDDGYGF